MNDNELFVKFHWFDVSTSFNCPCGEKEIYMDDSENEFNCRCGRVYKFIARLEEQKNEKIYEP